MAQPDTTAPPVSAREEIAVTLQIVGWPEAEAREAAALLDERHTPLARIYADLMAGVQ